MRKIHLVYSVRITILVFIISGFGGTWFLDNCYGQRRGNRASVIAVYKDPAAPIEKRIDDLMEKMTLEEKIGQLACMLGWEMYSKEGNKVFASEHFKTSVKEQHIGMLWGTLRADPWTKKTLITGLNPALAAEATNALQRYVIENTRLGIPLLLAEECAHGHMAIGTTVFPTSLGQGSTWNPDLIQRMAVAIAAEARLQGAHIGYGPILDISRDPRWSRVEETYGEDPYLIGRMGVAMVRGLQGDNLKSGVNVVSTLKHFTAYGVSEGGRNGGLVNIGNRELFTNFLPPFKEAIDAGALSVMTAYNSIDGVPCTSNRYLLSDIVKDKWGFNGFIVSDLGSIYGLRTHHRITDSPVVAASLALNAGVDVDLGGEDYGKNLYDALQSGLVDISDIDNAVRRVLDIKFRMGLFENPFVEAARVKNVVKNDIHVELARQVARESLVLLKNEAGLLPIEKSIKSIAVIGPNADNVYNQLGDYTAPQADGAVITVLRGIREKLSPETIVKYVKGCAIRDTTDINIDEAVEAARNAEIAIVVLGGSSARDFRTDYESTGAASVSDEKEGEKISDMESGEGFDRATLDFLGKQSELLKRVVETGTPVVLVLIQGRPLNLNWAEANVPAILNAWYPGQEGGHAIADVLFGDYNPAGRLPVTIPKSVGQLPLYYNHLKPERKSYVEMDALPLYCFGHGLSYTSFEYSDLKVKVNEGEGDIAINISFNLKNTGALDGDEVVQLYIRDMLSSVATPVKQLREFRRVNLKAGEQRMISFEMNAKDVALVNQDLQWVVEPGDFLLMIGASSEDIRLKSQFAISNKFVLKNQ